MNSTGKPWWINAHETPKWFGELCQMFVDEGLCDWSARSKPHPQDYALVATFFFNMLDARSDAK